MSPSPHCPSRLAVALVLGLVLAAPAPAFAGQPDQATEAPDVAPPPSDEAAPPPAAVPAPVYQPPPQQPIPASAPPPNRNRGLGLMIAGVSIFSFSYLMSVVVGVIMIDTNKAEIGRPLLIPVAGPFVAIGPASSASGSLGLAFAGIVQVAGVGMAIGGGAMFARSRQQARLSLTPGGLQLRF